MLTARYKYLLIISAKHYQIINKRAMVALYRSPVQCQQSRKYWYIRLSLHERQNKPRILNIGT